MPETEWDNSEILRVLEIVREIIGIGSRFNWNPEILVFTRVEGKSVNLIIESDKKPICHFSRIIEKTRWSSRHVALEMQ